FEVPVILWEDLGFIGLNPDNADVRRPVKKPRKRELNAREKALNRQISSKRVKIEHAIGQCKIFRTVKDKVRAVRDDFRDTCMLLACGLNNFKIDFIKT
ncbi:MAG: transposase family protein, partial [Bacteroidales bacterium]|nr:transposase family protein [Bacteroidales bacterium]